MGGRFFNIYFYFLIVVDVVVFVALEGVNIYLVIVFNLDTLKMEERLWLLKGCVGVWDLGEKRRLMPGKVGSRSVRFVGFVPSSQISN